MILYIQLDASYLSRTEARSVAGGIHYLGNKNEPFKVNGAIHVLSTIIPVVCSAVSEAEYGGVFINAKQGEWERTVLAALGHPQVLPTDIYGDNTTATGIANDTVKMKQSKAIDMRFHWVRDRVRQRHFNVLWRKGADNLADFFTKALPVHIHRQLMPLIVHTPRRAGRIGRSKHYIS